MKDKTMLKEIQIQYEKCLEEQKVENENKANLNPDEYRLINNLN